MSANNRDTQNLGPHIRVLGYKEDGEWVALALEMDLRGFGATFSEAVEELRCLMEAQVASAIEAGNPEAILFPAKRKWFRKWDETFRTVVTESLANRTRRTEDYNLADLPFPFWSRDASRPVQVSSSGSPRERRTG